MSHVKIYKGVNFQIKRRSNNEDTLIKPKKVIAFDLDETLGSFTDLEILWNTIIELLYLKNNSKSEPTTTNNVDLFSSIFITEANLELFNSLLDLYPEFLRYGILHILNYIYQKKKSGECSNIYIYTNNQRLNEWNLIIYKYFNTKFRDNSKILLFDRIIGAFKINNKRVEMNRTTHLKTYNDFINCTLLPISTEICFIDNTYFYQMKNERVYYIQPLPYLHNLSSDEIIKRFLTSDLSKKLTSRYENVEEYLKNVFNKKKNNNRVLSNNELIKKNKSDIFVAKKLMYHLKEFFYYSKKSNKTRKNRFILGRFTRKRDLNTDCKTSLDSPRSDVDSRSESTNTFF